MQFAIIYNVNLQFLHFDINFTKNVNVKQRVINPVLLYYIAGLATGKVKFW